MSPRFPVAPEAVHDVVRRRLAAKGLPVVLDLANSHGSWLRDQRSGRDYLDLSSFYAANPLGFNHPGLADAETRERLLATASIKVGNPDFFTTYLAEFIETLSRTAAPPELPHYFFVEGGALAVENAMKVAFDWKVQKNVAAGRGERGQQILHFTNAFHGRSGYTLSVTNTDRVKTDRFPKFDWPRIEAPAVTFPLDAENTERVARAEAASVAAIERAFAARPHDIAAVLIEPIQAEGGDNHFRGEFLRELRRLCDQHEALLIFDEVQSGMGITGRYWCCQHFGVMPDVIVFAKKLQVGGILVSQRIDDVKSVFQVPGRISSTWGGALVDMVRGTRVLEIIESDRLLDNAAARGGELLEGLGRVAARFPALIGNVRGRGLMCAVDLPTPDQRARVLDRAFQGELLLLPCGVRSVRFRPHLTVSAELVAEGLRRFESAVEAVAAEA